MEINLALVIKTLTSQSEPQRVQYVVHIYLPELDKLTEADQQKVIHTLLHEYEKITGLQPRKFKPPNQTPVKHKPEMKTPVKNPGKTPK